MEPVSKADRDHSFSDLPRKTGSQPYEFWNLIKNISLKPGLARDGLSQVRQSHLSRTVLCRDEATTSPLSCREWMGFPVGFVLSPCCRTQKNSVKWAVWFTWVTTSAIEAHCPSLCLRTPAVSAPSTRAPPLPSASSCFLLTRSMKQGKSRSPASLLWKELLLALLARYFHLTESGVSKPGFPSSFLGSFFKNYRFLGPISRLQPMKFQAAQGLWDHTFPSHVLLHIL